MTTVANGSVDEGWVGHLEAALDEANLPTLLLVMQHLTGDGRWTQPPYRPMRGKPLDDNDSGGFSHEVQADVKAAALQIITDARRGLVETQPPANDEVARMLACALVEDVPVAYGPLLAEEMGFISRDVEIDPASIPEGFKAVVIGAGLSGICMAMKLQQTGIDVVVLEKNRDLGGTWLENVYPGCGVDTPGHLYTFSFASNPELTRYFAKRDEVREYIQRVAVESGVMSTIEFGTEVSRATYSEATRSWTVETRSVDDRTTRSIEANVVISAVGMVNRPMIPALPGLADFPGPVMHTAAWDNSVDLTGKRVAVIGTGASAMQLVPAIVDAAEHTTIFQRSKQWALPHPNYHRAVSENVRFLMREVPFYFQWYRLRSFWNFSDRLHGALQIDPTWAHPERSVNEVNDRHREFLTKYLKGQLSSRPDLIEACLPDYPPYGKRPLVDNRWFETLLRDDVTLVDHAVDHVTADAVVDSQGRSVPIDIIALATGFKILQFLWPMEIVGLSGRTLREQWGENDARAYLGVTVPDFPNLFIVNGPNTNAGHGGSAIHGTEFQVRYVMQAIDYMLTSRTAAVEVRDDVFRRYNTELDDLLAQKIWAHPGMTTYYRNEAGRVVVTSPWKYLEYWEMLATFQPDEFTCSPATADEESASERVAVAHP